MDRAPSPHPRYPAVMPIRWLALLILAAPAAGAGRSAVAPVAVRAPSSFAVGSLIAPSLTPGWGSPALLAPGLPSAPGLVLPTAGPAALPLPEPAAALKTAEPSPVAAADAVAPAAAAPSAKTLENKPVLRALSESVEGVRTTGRAGPVSAAPFFSMFDGGAAANAADASRVPAAGIVNDEGVRVTGRAAQYYRHVRAIVDKYRGRLALEESLDVMDDAYADVWAKLAAIEAIADREVDHPNTHLERTLLWVDGVMESKGKRTAINTHRVYFHKAANPRSEIEEGIRRVDGYLKQSERYFARRGDAERALGSLDEVVLAFDSRGYAEIKNHLKKREKEFSRRYGRRFRFAYLDELVKTPKSEAAMREEFDRFTRRYAGDQGLDKIIEGVTYSRYVGLLLELRTVEHFTDRGYDLLQSGRELFDKDGKYVTELDLVVRSPEGKVSIVEAKSARVPIPNKEALDDKVVKKLDTYLAHWDELEKAAGTKIDGVTFSFDVGMNLELAEFLKTQEAPLSARYGVPVRFLFIESVPGEGRMSASRSPGGKKSRRRR